MGHHQDIHKRHYRQNLLDRDLMQFTKFIRTSVGETAMDITEDRVLPTDMHRLIYSKLIILRYIVESSDDQVASVQVRIIAILLSK